MNKLEKINKKGEFFMGVKTVEEEPFRDEYVKVVREKNKSKIPAVTVICIFCQRPAIETAEGYICPKCGHKPFKGIDLKRGYFTCKCGLLVDGISKECQGCQSHNTPFRLTRY